MIPAPLFTLLLWLSLIAIGGGVVLLIATLIREWRRGTLW
jgi:hypothetical protein